ncbi:MAG: restriction endonuclease [Planctomycetes bacterium]|nr:restriction endonuclease [Planctomycetota bacterium]
MAVVSSAMLDTVRRLQDWERQLSSSAISDALRSAQQVEKMVSSSAFADIVRFMEDRERVISSFPFAEAVRTLEECQRAMSSSGVVDAARYLEQQRAAMGLLESSYPDGSSEQPVEPQPDEGILLKAVVVPGDKTTEGQLIRAVAIPWFEIVRLLEKDPDFAHKIDWRRWEEIIAGAYEQAGFDEVILTPRSGDKGRDVVATKRGLGCIRFFDQVKAYSPSHLVDADEVRSMIGVITGAGNVSKGIITTTSNFAPGVEKDEYIKPLIPYRLELKPRDKLIEWLTCLSQNGL